MPDWAATLAGVAGLGDPNLGWSRLMVPSDAISWLLPLWLRLCGHRPVGPRGVRGAVAGNSAAIVEVRLGADRGRRTGDLGPFRGSGPRQRRGGRDRLSVRGDRRTRPEPGGEGTVVASRSFAPIVSIYADVSQGAVTS